MKKIVSILFLFISISFFNDNGFSQDGGEKDCTECPSLIKPGDTGGDEDCTDFFCNTKRQCTGMNMRIMNCKWEYWRGTYCEYTYNCKDWCDLNKQVRCY